MSYHTNASVRCFGVNVVFLAVVFLHQAATDIGTASFGAGIFPVLLPGQSMMNEYGFMPRFSHVANMVLRISVVLSPRSAITIEYFSHYGKRAHCLLACIIVVWNTLVSEKRQQGLALELASVAMTY